jgi:hypothetical protein
MNRFAATLLPLLLLLTSPAALFAGTTVPGPSVTIEPADRFRGDASVQQSATPAQSTVQPATSTTPQADLADEWQPLVLPTAVTTATIHSLIVHPQDAAIIYLATAQGLYRSNNAGTSWSRFDNLGDRPIFEVVQAEADPQRLYIRSWMAARAGKSLPHQRTPVALPSPRPRPIASTPAAVRQPIYHPSSAATMVVRIGSSPRTRSPQPLTPLPSHPINPTR